MYCPTGEIKVGGAVVRVSNHLVLSVLTTLFCCQILGLIAVLRSGEVNARVARGDYAGARQASRSALRLNLLNILACGALALVGTVAAAAFAI